MDIIGSPTSVAIYFKGARGYNNGVYVLNDICEELYSKKSEGITARSVNEEDFYNNMTEAGKTAKATYISDKVSALTTGTYITNVDTENNTVTYVTGRSYYPNIYAEENGSGIDTTNIKTNGIKDIETLKDADGNPTYDTNSGTNAYKQASTNGLTTKYTYYNISINDANYGDAYKALYKSVYWIASHYVL